MSAPLREARIDLDALRANIGILQRHVAPASILAVVKADAYGHGALPVAQAAVEAGVAQLGVADLDEAQALRRAGIEAPLLAWIHGPDADFASAIAAGIELGLSSRAQLDAVAELGGAVVHLKLDTGLSRNGCAREHWPALVVRAVELQAAGRVHVRGVFSHLANASESDDAEQRARFDEALEAAERAGLAVEVRHLASSQAAITTPEARFDLVRVGIAMYGLDPDASVTAASLGLRPVMRLAGSVVAVRRVEAGAGVSYGFTHRVARATTLALVGLGYADGVPRAASGRGAEVVIGGARHPIVGRIAMDQFVVDVGEARVAVGDEVVLWGDPATGAPSAEEWAAWAGTIGYEIVTRVGPRVPRLAVSS